MNTSYTDHDRLFKELIQTFFEEFIQLFFPQVDEYTNLHDVEFLSEELFTDVTVGETHRIDILGKVKLKGNEQIILIHVEPQSYTQAQFNERMFIYFSRLYEKYRKPILPIAVFAYDQVREEPDSFMIQLPFLDVLRFQFMTIVLKRISWRDYIHSYNPVAAALLSKMGYKKEEKVQVKKEFLRMLVHMELDEARMKLITGFFETYLQLSDKEAIQLQNEIGQMEHEEKEKVFQIMTSWEKKGWEAGKARGKAEGKAEGKTDGIKTVAQNMLKRAMDISTIAEVTGLSEQEIEALKKEMK